ncbi:hypothetical protein AAG570_013323 [Ranatra chinensis]|uniref:Reverse transcriptase domain-containing protein n=1 Tax=Ranatra chinensis TaxID=642074 RepID=A0ABD0YGG6_9HEMI
MEQVTTTTLEAAASTPDYTTMAQLPFTFKEALNRSSSRLRHRDYYGSRLRNSEAKRKIGGIRRPAERADQTLRLVEQRIQAGTDTTAIQYDVRILKKLGKKAVQMELPDELRGHVRTLDENVSFVVVLARIDEEEDNYQASKEDRNSDWKIVERRRDRWEVQREDRKIPPPPPPPQPKSPQKKTKEGQRRERPKRFVIKADYKTLGWVGKMDETSARINKWKEILVAHHFETIHTKRKDNVVADYLFRQVNAIEETYGFKYSKGKRDCPYDELKEILEQVTEMDRTYHIFISGECIDGKIIRWYSRKEGNTTLILCTRRVERFNGNLYQARKVLGMGNPISTYFGQLFLDEIEKTIVPTIKDKFNVTSYYRYVDDTICIIEDADKTAFDILNVIFFYGTSAAFRSRVTTIMVTDAHLVLELGRCVRPMTTSAASIARLPPL